MEQNDILNNKLIKKISKIEKMEAAIKMQKDAALLEIKKQLPKKTFLEMTEMIDEYAYSDEQLVVEEIRGKEAQKQKLEYDDYIAVLRIYNNIAPNMIEKHD